MIAIAISLACLTTAIALTSATGTIFEKLTHGKIPYKLGVTLCSLVSVFLSIKSVDEIIKYAVNILLFIYPITFTLILLLLLFGRFVTARLPYMMGIATTAVISLLSVLRNLNVDMLADVKGTLPLHSYQLEWLLPSFSVFIIFAILKKTDS